MIIDNMSLKLESGKAIAIIGESGAGMSTLLYILTGLVKPSSGKVIYQGEEVSDIVDFRRHVSGMISQNYLLFPKRTALENVMYPLSLKKLPKDM